MNAPRSCALSLLATLAACTPSAVPLPSATDASVVDAPAVDAPAVDAPVVDAPVVDAPAVDAPAVDVPVVACVEDSPCRAMGGVCDRVRGRCVECVTPDDCGSAGRSCASNRCVDAVTCTTSRMCPRQVCDPARGFCVDCTVDADCATGTVCRNNACVPPPRACRSSRECSELMLVCDPARGQCVECAADLDCADGQYCTAGSICRPRVCSPGAVACLDGQHARTCDARGSAWTDRACAARESCADGRCATWTCTPDTATCASPTARRVCNADGLGTHDLACDADQGCRAGACAARTCAPGASTCVDARTRRTCDADGLGATDTACPDRAGCVGGACIPWVCTPGAVDCASAGAERVCSADGQGYTMRPCAAGQSCRAGACRVWACTPGSTACRDLATMNVCDAEGAGYAPVACAAGSSCVSGMCAGWLCSPGATRCASGASTETCRADGLGYAAAVRCPTPAHAASATCAGGACAFTCEAGYADCNAAAGDGCETATLTTATSCGRCGNACPGAPNATPTCAGGVCGVACAAGYADCDGSAANGCEASLGAPTSCGRCGSVCAAPVHGAATCASGACGVRCDAGYNFCGGQCVADVAMEACNGADDDCDGVTDEGCGVGTCASPFVAAPSGGHYVGTMNGTGAQRATCGSSYNSGGVERIWTWTPARSGTATLRLTGDFWPATLYVRQAVCASGAQVACDSQSSTWPTENVTLSVTAGTTYFVFVDCHYNGTAYTLHYDLTVTAP